MCGREWTDRDDASVVGLLRDGVSARGIGGMSAYLSADELADLIGCKPNQRLAMAAWLTKNRWPHVLDRNGLPKVSRAFHDAKMGGTSTRAATKYATEPNRAAFDKKVKFVEK
jgi:hypothetical protein